MKGLYSILFLCFLLIGIVNYNVDATTYDGVVELPKTTNNNTQVDEGIPVKINLTVRVKKGNILEFDSNVSLVKEIEKLSGSTSPYIRITNLDNNEVVYSDFNKINQANNQEIKLKHTYPSIKSIKLDAGRYEIFYEYRLEVKPSKKDDPFIIEKSGGIPIRVK
ncbi:MULTISPECIES: hypothetical protein [Bacillaceae]|uniref:hypothetical protein n=1 Tax=Metabacillus sp. 22489 TaxID=3453928 RepID=UPI000BA5F01A|nr:hypothetical protein CHH83_18960 [Bacillus sp. 7586-K]